MTESQIGSHYQNLPSEKKFDFKIRTWKSLVETFGDQYIRLPSLFETTGEPSLEYGVSGTAEYLVRLREDFDELKREVEIIRSDLDSHLGFSEVEVRDLPREEIKKLIVDYVEEHGDFWPDEFANEFKLSVWATLETIDELVEEGTLERKDEDAVPRK